MTIGLGGNRLFSVDFQLEIRVNLHN